MLIDAWSMESSGLKNIGPSNGSHENVTNGLHDTLNQDHCATSPRGSLQTDCEDGCATTTSGYSSFSDSAFISSPDSTFNGDSLSSAAISPSSDPNCSSRIFPAPSANYEPFNDNIASAG